MTPASSPAITHRRFARWLPARPLTAEASAPSAKSSNAPGHADYAINKGSSQRFTDFAQLGTDAEGRLALSIFRAAAGQAPYELHCLERHPLGSQDFMPLSGQAFLIVVTPNHPDPESQHIFVSDGGQGIKFRRGVWHHPLPALTAGDFPVADRLGAGNKFAAVDIGGISRRLAEQPRVRGFLEHGQFSRDGF